MATTELAAKLNRRDQINEGEAAPSKVSQSVYAEFKEFSIQEIKQCRGVFQKYIFLFTIVFKNIVKDKNLDGLCSKLRYKVYSVQSTICITLFLFISSKREYYIHLSVITMEVYTFLKLLAISSFSAF